MTTDPSAAGLSRVLTDPERAALDRIRSLRVLPYGHVSAKAQDVAALVAFVERLTAGSGPAPEGLVDALAEIALRAYYSGGLGQDDVREVRAALAVAGRAPLPPEAYEAAEAWMRDQIAAREGGQAATHDTDTDEFRGVSAPSEPGMVAFEVEVTPHDPGRDGHGWHKGTGTPAKVAATLRDYAEQVESFTSPQEAASRAAATDSGEDR